MKRTFVCVSSCIKHYVQPSYGCRGTPVVARLCVYTALKKILIHNFITKKYWNKNEKKKFGTKSRDAAVKKNIILKIFPIILFLDSPEFILLFLYSYPIIPKIIPLQPQN